MWKLSQVLEEHEYKQWLKRHLLAQSSIENQEELLQDSAKSLETNLTLLGRTAAFLSFMFELWQKPKRVVCLHSGATGILDRLQEEVPETIEALQRAGIKLWVLTGDKMETAINIAYASKLLRPIDQLLTANCDSKVKHWCQLWGVGRWRLTHRPTKSIAGVLLGRIGMAGAFLLPLSSSFSWLEHK